MGSLRHWPLVAFIAVCAAPVVRGQPPKRDAPDADKWLFDRTLAITPREESKPALAYRLFPTATDRKEGNAVPIYLRLNFEQSDAARRKWTETPKPWNAMPVDKVPLSEAKAFLDEYKNFFRQFELGARRKTADWNYTLDQGSIIDVLLPDVQTMRGYVPMMVLRVRVALAEGDFAAAAHGLETGFAFSQHVGDGPFLINRLVGIACGGQFADCLLDLIERPAAPNLYWPLTALPRPLIDLREAMEIEQKVMEMQFPELADLDRPRSPEQWDLLLKKVRTEFARLVQADREGGAPWKPLPGTAADDPASKSPDLPAARKHLVERRKLAADAVDAMPAAQVLLTFILDSYHEFRDDAFKASYLPYTQARKVFDEAEARRKASPDTEARRFPDALLPAIVKVQSAQTRLDRKIAALRVIEAVRLHAAANDGRLPDKLTAITLVPVPDDPGTGKPFGYERDQDTAILTSRIPGEGPEVSGLRYRLTIRKK